jgi:hypothetical protein
MRVLAGGALLLAAVGCGAGDSGRAARPQTVKLGWHENCGTRADRIPIVTRDVIVRRHRWRVDLSLRNETRVALSIFRPHFPGSTYFGLEAFETASKREVLQRARIAAAKPQTIADRFSPARPILLAPAQAWRGWFSGPGALPAGVPIRVVLGRFVILGKAPPDVLNAFLCISDHVVRLR